MRWGWRVSISSVLKDWQIFLKRCVTSFNGSQFFRKEAFYHILLMRDNVMVCVVLYSCDNLTCFSYLSSHDMTLTVREFQDDECFQDENLKVLPIVLTSQHENVIFLETSKRWFFSIQYQRVLMNLEIEWCFSKSKGSVSSIFRNNQEFFSGTTVIVENRIDCVLW